MNRFSGQSDFSVAKTVLTFFLMVVLGGAGFVLFRIPGAVGGALLAILFFYSIVINQEYIRAVVFRLGSYSRVLGPGLNIKLPFLEWVEKIDYRVKTVNVRPQKVLTRDNVTVTVDAIVFYRVRKDPEEIKKAVLEAENYDQVTVNYGQSMLRAIIGKKMLDDILQNREKIAVELREDLDQATNEFGISIRDVEIQDVSIPDSMERAMAAEAEAERSRRAKLKEAEGELQAAVQMRAASDIMGKGGYQLRVLETLGRVAEENSTIITVPAEMIPAGSDRSEDDRDSPVQNVVNDVLKNINLQDVSQSVKDITESGESSES